MKDTVNSSSDNICLFGVELFYGCYDLGDDLWGRNIPRSYSEVQSCLFFSNKFFKLLLMSVFGGVKDSLGVGLNLL